MKNLTKYLQENIFENKKDIVKADIGFGSLGSGTTIWNRSEMVRGDYETVAHVRDNGEITWHGRFKDSKGKNLDSNSYKVVMDMSRKKIKAAKKEEKAGKKALNLMNANTNFKVKTDDGEVRTVVQHKNRIFYYVSGKQLAFTHSKQDVVQLIKNGVYEIVESSTDIFVGQPLMFGNMDATIKSINESEITLDVDGEVFETTREDLSW